MLTYEQIFERHLELRELREFKTIDEIVKYLEGGATLWQVESYRGGPAGVAKNPTVVISVGTYEGPVETLQDKPTCLTEYEFGGKKHTLDFFITSMQCVPAKAVFSTRERAEAYSAAVEKAFAEDPEWQADVEHEKRMSDELDAANEADMNYLDEQSWEDDLIDAPEEKY